MSAFSAFNNAARFLSLRRKHCNDVCGLVQGRGGRSGGTGGTGGEGPGAAAGSR